MFGLKKSEKQLWNAFFSVNVEIEGSLRFTGLLNIDGRLKGAVVAKGMLVTGTSAHIEGDIYVENLVLSGSVTGNIYATGEVHLNQSAVVKGNINYCTLSIVPGAVHEGNSHRFSDEEKADLIEKIANEIVNIDKNEIRLEDKKLKKKTKEDSKLDEKLKPNKTNEQLAAAKAEKGASFSSKKDREVAQLNVLNNSAS
jgi:cytoskeletal protein CcmA (bactofilin family)